MKKIWLFAVLLVLLACNKQEAFIDERGGFSIVFDGEPSLSIDTFVTDLGPVVLYAYMNEISSQQAQTVSYSDYPVGGARISDPFELINGAKRGALQSLGITEILRDEAIELNGIPGVEVIGNNGEDVYIHYKLFLKDNRLYQIGYLKEGELADNAEELGFIESFTFLVP